MIKIGGEMIKLLTTKESTLLRKLANLLKEYDAIISCDTSDEVKILVFEGDKDVKRVPIILPKSFDEEDIADLLNETSRRIEWIAKNKEVNFLLPDEEEG